MPKTLIVDLEPIGRRVTISEGMTLLDAARAAGVEVASLCAGEGWCGKCRLRLINGELTPPTQAERDFLEDEQIVNGLRLACQSLPLSDVKVYIPPESLGAGQRLQIEARELSIPLDPPVIPQDIELTPPRLDDPRPDLTRLHDALGQMATAPLRIPLTLLSTLSDELRGHDYRLRLALRGSELAGLFPLGTQLLGLAVDIGTTKLAAYLIDLESGKTVAQEGATNPQLAYGEDVISRIAYANQHHDGRQVLQSVLIMRLNELAGELCAPLGASPHQIVEAVVVGNTVMQHLFLGLPVRQLGEAPFIAVVGEALEIRAEEIGLNIAPAGLIYLPANIAAYVGSDHVATLLASEALQRSQKNNHVVLAIDIGTNTEVSLALGGEALTCSCASGPAFEGAHIRDGMRAATGAIERVQIIGNRVHIQTIGGMPPVGICGSGILDAIAEMQRAHLLTPTGNLRKLTSHVGGEGANEFLLVPAERTGHGRDIAITRKDIHEVQLAKAAIRAGIEILLEEANLKSSDIKEFIIAGAFGSYLDIQNAVQIGMFPPLPLSRFIQIGNAAGSGARQMLVSRARRDQAVEIVRRLKYIELTLHPRFSKLYVNAMAFR